MRRNSCEYSGHKHCSRYLETDVLKSICSVLGPTKQLKALKAGKKPHVSTFSLSLCRNTLSQSLLSLHGDTVNHSRSVCLQAQTS